MHISISGSYICCTVAFQKSQNLPNCCKSAGAAASSSAGLPNGSQHVSESSNAKARTQQVNSWNYKSPLIRMSLILNMQQCRPITKIKSKSLDWKQFQLMQSTASEFESHDLNHSLGYLGSSADEPLIRNFLNRFASSLISTCLRNDCSA